MQTTSAAGAPAVPPPAPGAPPPAAPGGPGPVPVPPGPGVQPPFAAPPVEGRTARLWLGLAAAGLAVVLCCGGGLVSVVGLVITIPAAISEQAHSAVADYLQAVAAERYDDAYQLLCDDLQRRDSLGEFTDRVAAEPKVTEYELHPAVFTDDEVTVPADLTYTDGARARVSYLMAQEDGTGELKVCGTTG